MRQPSRLAHGYLENRLEGSVTPPSWRQTFAWLQKTSPLRVNPSRLHGTHRRCRGPGRAPREEELLCTHKAARRRAFGGGGRRTAAAAAQQRVLPPAAGPVPQGAQGCGMLLQMRSDQGVARALEVSRVSFQTDLPGVDPDMPPPLLGSRPRCCPCAAACCSLARGA